MGFYEYSCDLKGLIYIVNLKTDEMTHNAILSAKNEQYQSWKMGNIIWGNEKYHLHEQGEEWEIEDRSAHL